MHINLCNLIFITTICSTVSIVYAWRRKDSSELPVNATKNETNYWPMHPKGSTPNNREEETNSPGIVDFLTSNADLSILNISFNSNEKVINILKSIVSSSEDKEASVDVGSKETNDFKSPTDYNTVRNSTSTRKMHQMHANPISKENGAADYEPAINLLKAADSFLPAKENKYIKHNESSTKSKPASQDLDEASKTHTNTEAAITSTEIILSEITHLSPDNGEKTPLGQKIEFQRSKMDSEQNENSNKAGKEILQNITGSCGYLLGKRISFAEPTTLMEFPWTALLLYNTNIRYHCGGSLITLKYVLTAAHCVAQEFYELIGVRLGEYDISEPIDCALDVVGSNICAVTVDVNVVKIIVHHDYSHLSFKNDIALLRLDKEYIGRSFYPICLPTPEMIYAGNVATVAGWGATEKAIRSSILLKATVPIFDISKCREIYRYNIFNDTTEICASGANEVDVCKGDSGGAIFYGHAVGRREKFFQLGIISLGVRGCGDKRFLPAVFTKLNAFYKWIENNLEY